MTHHTNRPSRRRFIRHLTPSSRRWMPAADPSITIDRQRLYDVLDSLESFSGE